MIAGRFIQESMPIETSLSPLRRYYVVNLDDLEDDIDPNIDDLDGYDWSELCGSGWSRSCQMQEDRPSNRKAFSK